MARVAERARSAEKRHQKQRLLWMTTGVLGILTVVAGWQAMFGSQTCPTHPDVNVSADNGTLGLEMSPAECRYVTDPAAVQAQLAIDLGIVGGVLDNPNFLARVDGSIVTNGMVAINFTTPTQDLLMGVKVTSLEKALEENSKLVEEGGDTGGAWWQWAIAAALTFATAKTASAAVVSSDGVMRHDGRNINMRGSGGQDDSEGELPYVFIKGQQVDRKIANIYREGVNYRFSRSLLPGAYDEAESRLETAIEAAEAMLRDGKPSGYDWVQQTNSYVLKKDIYSEKVKRAEAALIASKKLGKGGRSINVELNAYLSERAMREGSVYTSPAHCVAYVYGNMHAGIMNGFADELLARIDAVNHDLRHEVQMRETSSAIADQVREGMSQILGYWIPLIKQRRLENAQKEEASRLKKEKARNEIIERKFMN
jgi:hypothetical protein